MEPSHVQTLLPPADAIIAVKVDKCESKIQDRRASVFYSSLYKKRSRRSKEPSLEHPFFRGGRELYSARHDIRRGWMDLAVKLKKVAHEELGIW